jgi:alanine racemase
LEVEGLYTHFPTAEKDDGFREKQTADFNDLIQKLGRKGINFQFRHTSNSAGILKADNSPFNLIRPGLMLYGIYPDASLAAQASAAPVLSLKSRIILVKRLAAGESAGYGRDFVAKKTTTIAVIPVGYSHGYPFSASNKAEILYQGKRFSIAGRVSMDYLTVDLGDAPAHAGDEVTLIGEEQNEIIRAEDVARWAGTIPYEIVTRLVGSLPRFYR